MKLIRKKRAGEVVKKEKKSLDLILKEYKEENELNNGDLKDELLTTYKELKFYKHKWLDKSDPEMSGLDKYLSALKNDIKIPLVLRISLILRWEKTLKSPSLLLLFAIMTGVIPMLLFGGFIADSIVNLFDNNGFHIWALWAATIISIIVAIFLQDKLWARVTIILFSISVGMFTAHKFSQDGDVILEVTGEDIIWVNAMNEDKDAILTLINDLDIIGEPDKAFMSNNIDNLLVNEDMRNSELGLLFTLNSTGNLSAGDSTGIEIRHTQNSMQTSDIVSLSLAIAAVLITIFETIIAGVEKRKNLKKYI